MSASESPLARGNAGVVFAKQSLLGSILLVNSVGDFRRSRAFRTVGLFAGANRGSGVSRFDDEYDAISSLSATLSQTPRGLVCIKSTVSRSRPITLSVHFIQFHAYPFARLEIGVADVPDNAAVTMNFAAAEAYRAATIFLTIELWDMYAALLIERNSIAIALPKSDVTYYPQIGLTRSEKTTYYKQLTSLPYWKQPSLIIYGRPTRAPRLTCSFGSQPNKVYRYSGTTATLDSVDYPPPILHIKSIIEKILNTEFNFVLLNWYKNGNDCIGEHSDNERELKKLGVIACVSLGAERNFVLRNKVERRLVRKLALADGSMVVMKGNTQANWKHSVPREKKIVNGRISLTFRQLV
ncbi:11529_t:CDS:2 [Ambispora gerdemannii]|uniref:11529_t:CDS:1 n=1 Tax=Ambispora gerdemannii TaxID=144530 RepID=A0A9N9EXY6_9GLOM|nr:11529_t:CDS:2 [Ambispora gerdemannii]